MSAQFPTKKRATLGILAASLAVIRKDLLLEWRGRARLNATIFFAVMTLLTTLQMKEQRLSRTECENSDHCATSTMQALRLTLQAGGWILKTPFALVIILAGLMFDNCIRMVLTLGSQYYRLISLPEASFGLIGSGFALLGLVIPRLEILQDLVSASVRVDSEHRAELV